MQRIISILGLAGTLALPALAQAFKALAERPPWRQTLPVLASRAAI